MIEKFQSTLRGLMGAMLTPTTAWADVERMIVGKPFAKVRVRVRVGVRVGSGLGGAHDRGQALRQG